MSENRFCLQMVACEGSCGTPGSGSGEGKVYSTEEHVVGTWIDGKAIYERTYVSRNITISGGKLAEAIEDIDQVVNIAGFANCIFSNSSESGHWTWPINTAVATVNPYYLEVYYMKSNQAIAKSGLYCHLILSSTELYKDIFVTIQYTKV